MRHAAEKDGKARAVPPLRRVRHALEAAAVVAGIAVFRLMPVDLASGCGGYLLRLIGPFLREHRIAEDNLRQALPALTDAEVAAALRGMWVNLGRVAAESAHLGALARDPGRVAVVDRDGALETVKRSGKGALIVSGHFGNWELVSVACLRAGLVQHTVYRAPNNPLVDRLICWLRRPTISGTFIPKGRKGLWAVVAGLRRHELIAMLVDQKLKEGIFVPFFGREARTTTSPAVLSRRFDVPVVLARVDRLRGARFRVTLSLMPSAPNDDGADGMIERTRRLNRTLESWIRERPDQWLWAHRRWPR